jgi:diacylglycerol O-acyltransferase
MARHPIATVGDTVTVATSVARFVSPVTTTDSPVMSERHLRWRYDVLDVPTGALREAGHRAGGSLNDAFLAAITGGLRIYHDRHGRGVEELRVTMPVSIRGDDDPEGGNRITLMRFEVPVAVADPGERMHLIGARCRQARDEPAIAYTNAIAAILNRLPIGITGGMLKHVDFLASNVPGFPSPVYVAGARLEALYPFGPTLGAALNVTLMSYRGTCNIGINTDAGAVPDADALVACLQAGFEEVLGVTG